MAKSTLQENRDCFKTEQHAAHVWHEKYYCTGNGLDKDGYVKTPLLTEEEERELVRAYLKEVPKRLAEYEKIWKQMDSKAEEPFLPPHIVEQLANSVLAPSPLEALLEESIAERELKNAEEVWAVEQTGYETLPGDVPILSARSAYGDPSDNMREQAALWNAYLSGREIRAHDVPIMFILVKLHRMGKMPDYKDNYDDVKGYLRMAEDLIGEDMIDAPTAAEYQKIKQRGIQAEGRGIDKFQNQNKKPEGFGNPYRNCP